MIFICIKYLILCIIIYWIYFKLSSRYWSTQPIFHYHNLYYWLYFRGVIHKQLPAPDKFYRCDIKSREGILTQEHIDFLKNNYSTSKDFVYIPQLSSLNVFLSKDYKAIITEYRENNTLLGMITSIQVRVIYNSIQYNAYYADNLCIHKKNRGKYLLGNIISSHVYNQRKINDIPISISKREGKLSHQVPIVSYLAYVFNLYKFKSKSKESSTTLLGVDNIRDIEDYIEKSRFKLKIVPIYSTFLELIKTRHIKIYAIIYKNNIAALWFFRKSESKYLNHSMIECIASINISLTEELFKSYIVHILSNIDEDFLIIYNLSMNHINISKLLSIQSPICVINTEYYYYNFIQLPLKEEETFILC